MSAPSSVSILVVDDNASKRFASRAALAPLGYEIVEADSGLTALRCVMAQNFAVILLDVRMPIMDGFETAALIRQREQAELTPIIFITAHGSEETEQNDRYADGAFDFIFAPVPPGELRAKVSVFANLFLKSELLAARAQEVQASADQLRLLTDAAPIGIFQTDVENRYVYTNPRWSEITGIPPEAATRQVWPAPAGAVDPAAMTDRFEIEVPGADPRTVLVKSKTIPDRRGEIAGWVGALSDVTAEALAQAALSDARDAAVLATLMQKNLAASASHELRTPTTSILGYTEELLESETVTDQDREFVKIVYRNAQRLTQLIDDLMILSQADVGALIMHLDATPLAPLIERIVINFGATASAGITLVNDRGPISPIALVDPLRLEQVLTNLVSNALKFTPPGGEVTVRVTDNDEVVEITVEDTGMGIEPADLDHIFGRFYRTRAAFDSAVAGSGLGLAIAKGMIEAQNGRIRVTSTVGRGSAFVVTVPVTTSELQTI